VGLLDSLFAGPSQGGGLLDFLRNNAMNQQFSSGLPSDQAQYGSPMGAMAQAPMPTMPQQNAQPSPLDNAQWPYGPNGAPSQANAQMQPGVPQQPPAIQAPQSQPGFLDRLNTGFQSIGNGGSILGALTGNMTDPVTQQRQTQNLTLQALQQKGIDPVTAQAAISNPELLKTIVAQAYGPKTVTPLGNGYVADKNGNIKRAYEPEDKIPAGFAKDDNGNMRFIPGGPADPAYIQLAEAKKKDPNGNYTLGRGGELRKTLMHRATRYRSQEPRWTSRKLRLMTMARLERWPLSISLATRA
jgi:hypothetical protein